MDELQKSFLNDRRYPQSRFLEWNRWNSYLEVALVLGRAVYTCPTRLFFQQLTHQMVSHGDI